MKNIQIYTKLVVSRNIFVELEISLTKLEKEVFNT